MRVIHATYNMLHNSIDVTTFDGYILRIDCEKAEEGLKTTPCSECALNALTIDNPLEYAILYLDGCIQIWIDAEDSLELEKQGLSRISAFCPIALLTFYTLNI